MKPKFTLLLFIMLVLFNYAEAVQLTGTYTINPLQPASATNFQNIRSAVTYMTSTGVRADAGPANSGTLGVSGPVVFLLSSATYTEQVVIPAITGASTTNTVVFQGTGKASTIFTFASSDANNRHTLKMNLCTNVTFRDMTIRATGTTYGWVVHIMGLNSNNNKIKNCIVEVTGTGATSTSTNFNGIIINNSATSATTGTRVDGTEIDSNIIRAGYYGIVAAGASSNLHVGLKIRNNHITDVYYYGSYLNYINGVTYTNNYIKPRVSNTTNIGVYLINSTCTAPNRHIVAFNKIVGIGQYAFYLSAANNIAGNKGLFYNNMLGGGIKYDYSRVVYFTNSSQWSVHNNTFNHDLTANSNLYSAVYFNAGSGISFMNNIASVTATGPALPLYATAFSCFDTINYNAYYRRDTSNGVLVYIGANYNSGSFIGAGSQNANSLFVNPLFINDTNFNIDNACLRGTSIGYITTDFYGRPRPSVPVMGAYEPTAVANDVKVFAITKPSGTISAGPTDVDVFIRNAGSATLTSFALTYVLNGGTPVVYNWTGSLNSCDTATLTFTGAQQATLGNVNNFVVYSSGPNGVLDSVRSNDTIRASYYLPFGGTYNIGGSTPHFAKLSDAATAVTIAGLSGPVTFLVQPGTYIDQAAFDNAIPGLDSINTITIQGTNKDSCIILHTDAFSNRHIIRLGQSHIRIKNLTLRSTNSSFGWGVHIGKTGLRNIHVKNCNIEFTHANAYTSTSDGYNGVVMSGSNNSLYYYDVFTLSDFEIDSNNFLNGYSGIWHYSYYYGYYFTPVPSSNLKMRNNTITNAYYYAVNFTFVNGFEVSGNSVRMRSDNTSSYALYFYEVPVSGSATVKINANRVWNSGYSGMYMYNCTAPAGNRGQIINNEFGGGYKSTSPYGIQLNSVGNFDIYHNSVVHDVVTTTATSAAFYLSGGSGNRIRNNHFVVSKSGSLGTPLYLSSGAASQLNYNNYYKPDTAGNYIYVGSWLTKSAFPGASGFNQNSIAQNPGFQSDTSLVTSNGCLNGDTIALVTTDRNGLTRSAVPDIGAYEIPAASDDAGITAILAPSFPVLQGTQDLQVQFRNYGGNNIGSLNLNYRFNNGTVVSSPWSGLLAPCDTTSFVFTGTQQITIAQGSLNTIKVYTSTPNLNPDGNTLNDTLNAILATPMKGTYIIGAAPSDFTTFDEAKNALQIRGVDSAVLFSVKSGTYTEQLQLSNVAGLSATNTVTFASIAGVADSVVVRFNSGASNNYVLKIMNARYFNFTNIRLEAQNSTYGRVVEFTGNCSNTSFSGCKFVSPVVSTTSTNNTIVYSNPFGGSDVRFANSIFSGGSYGIYLFGTSTTQLMNNIIVDSNQFTNQYYTGTYLYYTSNLKLRRNNISTTQAYTSFYGLYCYYGDSALEITNNRIYSTTSSGYGIRTEYCDGFGAARGLIANNIITLGATSTTYGIYDRYASNLTVINNTVSIVNNTSGYAGYFYYSSSIYSGNVIRNNIFANFGTGYAVYHYSPLYGHSDYNLLFTSGTLLVQKGTPAATYANLGLAKAGLGNTFEFNSIQSRPGFTANNNVIPNPSDTNVWAINGRGVILPAVPVNDYAGTPRVLNVANGAPDLGAYEVVPVSTPPLCLATPAVPVAGGTQVFTIGADTVCTIVYDAFATAPSVVSVRQYTNTTPPYLGGITNNMTMYLDVNAPAGFYNYTMNMYYKDQWIGTNPSEYDIKLAKKSTNGPWTIYQGTASVADTQRNVLSTPNLYEFSIFTGTDNTNPLPVKLVNLAGENAGNDALLKWQTASEVNCQSFTIERALVPGEFKEAGVEKAAGNSSELNSYAYTDKDVFNKAGVVYYRLKINDFDGKTEYSQVVMISKSVVKGSADITVHPNPFKAHLTLNNVTEGQTIELADIAGRTIIRKQVTTSGRFEMTDIDCKPGVYFLKAGGQTIKVVKE